MSKCSCVYILTHTFILEAVVGLESTFYSVSEAVGLVEVCAIVFSPTIGCPIAFPFDVSLSTSDDTAGSYCLLKIKSAFTHSYSLFMLNDINIDILFAYLQWNLWTILDSQGF